MLHQLLRRGMCLSKSVWRSVAVQAASSPLLQRYSSIFARPEHATNTCLSQGNAVLESRL